MSSLKQELNLSKQRVKELQHALEDDMDYNSDGMSNDDDDDIDLSDSDSDFAVTRSSKPRSYQSFDSLEPDEELGEGLKQKLGPLVDDDTFGSSPRSPRGEADGPPKPRRMSNQGDEDGGYKRRKSAEHKKRRGSDRRRSAGKTDTSIDS